MSTYLIMAFDKNALGGQQAFVIRQSADDAIIGMTRFYEINPKDKRQLAIHGIHLRYGEWFIIKNANYYCCNMCLKQPVLAVQNFM